MKKSPVLFVLLLASLLSPRLAAQDAPAGDAGWNSARAVELIRRAQQRRAAANADTGLVNYQSDARLYAYFYLDRPDTGERNLVKTDQLALDVFWQAPDLVKQRIIGWRDEKSLPTNIRYHIDHLTVVQENFGDEIRLGDGDEVRGVAHPAAPGAERVYDYRLADSLTLRLPGVDEPVRVYELKVRPRNPDQPGFLGSVFVERRAGDIVRMDFTFTAASYIDRFLDYINISLDNGLWRGRFWLPNEQRVEIRRRIPELDIPAGSVIRANMRIGNYRFNQPLPPATFAGPPVVAAPREQREAFPFEQEIHAEVREEGIGPQVELRDIRRVAAELVEREALERAARLRLRIPRASEVLRYNRAEGLVLAAGAGATPVPGLRVGVQGGWAFGAEHPLGTLALTTGSPGGRRWRGSLYLNRPRDVGIGPPASGALNTLSALFAGEDFLDPFYASGASLSLLRPLSPAWSLEAELRAERQRSARLRSDFSLAGDFRPVHPIDRADLFWGGAVTLRRERRAEAGGWWSGALSAEAGVLNAGGAHDVGCLAVGPPCESSAEGGFVKPQLEAGWGRRWMARDAALELSGRAGFALGELPPQALYLLGGRGTLPGYGFREFGGDRFALARATASAELWSPWVRGRALGALGWADAGSAGAPALASWPAQPTGTLKPSLGAGVGLLHDILHVDLARGLGRGGTWELIVEANPSFWDFL